MNRPVRFIAEACSNHNGSLERAIALIEKAKEIGCWGVKFQMFKIDKLFHDSVLSHPDYDFVRLRRQWELSKDWIPSLKVVAQNNGIAFGCTPFDSESVAALEPYVDFLKIASYSILDLNLIELVSKCHKKTFLSTGMASHSEIKEAKNTFLDHYHDLTLLHCVSRYPTPITESNLCQIESGMGLSDHSVEEAVIFRAAHHYNCPFIEFHLDLDDEQGWESKPHSWIASDMKKVICTINQGLIADGHYRYRSGIEQHEAEWRSDPSDGLRPLIKTRNKLKESTINVI